MHGIVVKFTKYGLLCFEGRLYTGTTYRGHKCLSEAAARSWLALQGVPVNQQSPIAIGIKG